MHRIVCYDIANNRRRARFFKGLKRFLEPVQRSVFEGPLPERLLHRLHGLIERELDPRADTVRLYSLCPRCAASIHEHGVPSDLLSSDGAFIIG